MGNPGDILGKSWGNLGEILGKYWRNLEEILAKSWGNLEGIMGKFAVDNYIIWRISGTKFGAYFQQWIAIRGATCICDAVLTHVLTQLDNQGARS